MMMMIPLIIMVFTDKSTKIPWKKMKRCVTIFD